MRTPPGTRRPHEIDAANGRWLAWHEAVCHSLVGREVRDLGDGVMLHDPADREPFWNRIAGIAWPRDPAAFDRRLAEMLALFAGLDRVPHMWPSPAFDEPPDLIGRLEAHGFVDMGAGLLMGLDVGRLPPESLAAGSAGQGIELDRFHRLAGEAAARAAREVAVVLAEAFSVEPDRRAAIEEEMIVLLGREDFEIYLARVDGEPAATARRTTFAGASYLSSIGTRPAFRGRGLGRIVTDAVTRRAVEAGAWTYLGVFNDNEVARRLYEELGFVTLGGPSPDLLLRA
jgi:ribosomal protein S18 acetylase RimI-like enzyme